MKRTLFFILVLLFFCCRREELRGFTLVTSDIINFWEAYDSVKVSDRKEEVFSELYLERASKPFLKIIESSGDINNPNNYLESFEKNPKFWKSLREPSIKLQNLDNEITASYRKIKDEYPNFEPGDICVFIGVRKIKGTVFEKHNLIFLGGELNVPYEDVDLSEFDEHETISYHNNIKLTIVHEAIHLQQHGESEMLLGKAILEGSANFLAELFLNESYKSPAYIYGKKNERIIWETFSQEMYTTNTSKWFNAESLNGTWPADLGYYMGYAITKSYFDNAENKKAAIKQIIEVQDFNEFFESSRYKDKF